LRLSSLIKEVELRPKYPQLLSHPFVVEMALDSEEPAQFIRDVLDQMTQRSTANIYYI
jgi:hypothetical protein